MATEEVVPAEEAPAEPEAQTPVEEAAAPVIVIKKVMDGGHGGAHGGAWKIALADMMTAMMAFFLLMWLLGATNSDQRKGIADYFKPSSHSLNPFGQLAGSNGVLGGRSIIDPDAFPYAARQTGLLERLTPRSEGGPNPVTEPGEENDNPAAEASNKGSGKGEGKGAGKEGSGSGKASADELTEEEKEEIAKQQDEKNFKKLETEIKAKLGENKRLAQLKDQVQVSRDKEGLRVEIIDKADFAMFPSGSDGMQGKAQELVAEVAKTLSGIPNKLAIRGHTDAVPFKDPNGKNNWSLSAERAEATRQVLSKSGVAESRFVRIEGVSDTDPFNPKDKFDPRNRRMSITVLNTDPNEK
jgi:chemotaxis protein MotB